MKTGRVGRDPVARLALTDGEIESGAHQRKIDAFVESVRAAVRK